LEAPALQVRVELVDGRQLLPAVGSPCRPEKEEDDLAPELGEVPRVSLEVGEVEGGRRLRRVVRLELEGAEVRARGRGGEAQPSDEKRAEECDAASRDHDAPLSRSAFKTSSGSRRSSGLSWILTYFTTPSRSMMK